MNPTDNTIKYYEKNGRIDLKEKDDIISKIEKYVIERSNIFEQQTKGTKDEYNIYNEHIKYVYKYVILLSDGKKVDLEVLKLSALLHDIAMTDKELDRSKHNEYGALIAEKLLRELDYPEKKVQLVKKCILNHSNKRLHYRTTEEEKILVDADILSHFDSISSLYSLAHNVIGLNDIDSIEFVREKLTKDFNEISSDLRYLVIDKYNKIMNNFDIKDWLHNY